MKLVLDYQGRAGAPAHAPARWPESTALAVVSGEPNLLVFVHPRCPCSRATLAELEHIAARTQGRLHAQVVFVIPPGQDPRWAQSDLWRKAAAIPGVRIGVDQDGLEARRFGSATSGQMLVYDGGGGLRFAGGITAGRGHEGRNAGGDAVVTVIQSGSTGCTTTPVYGCALESRGASLHGNLTCPR